MNQPIWERFSHSKMGFGKFKDNWNLVERERKGDLKMSEKSRKSSVMRSKSVITPSRQESKKTKTKRNFSFSFRKPSDDNGGTTQSRLALLPKIYFFNHICKNFIRRSRRPGHRSPIIKKWKAQGDAPHRAVYFLTFSQSWIGQRPIQTRISAMEATAQKHWRPYQTMKTPGYERHMVIWKPRLFSTIHDHMLFLLWIIVNFSLL